jgi:Asp-tRNA(Asn)/Glu-tRNA(Gln) amidotransferase A subunit family amidase
MDGLATRDAVTIHTMPTALSPLRRLRTALDSGETTPKTVAEQALARANSNAGKNVYLALDPQYVLSAAATLTGRFPTNPRPSLFGLPVSLKDCFDLANFRTTCGSRFYAEFNGVAGQNSALADRLLSQGAVIVGKTHMHPLAYGITGENPDFGDCVQPNNAQLLTGGSSSGSAASVQEGSAVAAIGTDTGGSIRVPAALCGLAGYRASADLAYRCDLWRGGMHLAPSFDTLGWLFANLRDGPVLAQALFGLDVPETVKTRIRIGCPGSEFLQDCEPAVLDAFTLCQQRLRELGAEVGTFDSSFWHEAMDIYAPIQAHEAAGIHSENTGGDFSVFEKTIAERLVWGESIRPSEVDQLRRRHRAFRDHMDSLLLAHDFLISPCAPVCHLLAGADHTDTRRAILRHTTPASLAGIPVITLPAESGAGIQLMAARGSDSRLLAFAAELEERLL